MSDKNFEDLEQGEFIEIYVKALDQWLLCEVVTNYGIVHWDENSVHYGYFVELVNDKVSEDLYEKANLHPDQRLYITEGSANKWWRHCKNAKVLFGNRKEAL